MTYRLLLSIFAIVSILAAPASAETVRWGRSADAATLDPHAATDPVTMQLVRNIYEPLVAFDAAGQPAGKLASSWIQSSDDPNVWVFILRQAVFHDGSVFDAEDVVFSYDRARATGSPFADKADGIISVRVLDPRTIEIRFADASPVLPAVVADILVMDREWAETNKVTEAKGTGDGKEPFSERHANGTGPYRLDSRDADVRTKLVANERYHRARPVADTVIYLPIVNPGMQAVALERGEIDVLQDVAAADIARFAETDGISVATGPANAVLYLGFDIEEAAGADAERNPFSEPKVREAITLAIRRSDVAARVDNGHGVATALLAPPFVNGWSKGLAAPLAPGIDRAKALMVEAGYADGFEIELDVANGDEPAAEQIEAMLMDIGIEVDVTARPAPAHQARLEAGDSDFYLADYSAPGYDSAAIMAWLLDRAKGEDVSELRENVEALADMRNGPARNAEIARLWLELEDLHVVLPLAQRQLAHAMRDTISVPVDPDNLTPFEAIRFAD